jgi:hypothetical protein
VVIEAMAAAQKTHWSSFVMVGGVSSFVDDAAGFWGALDH